MNSLRLSIRKILLMIMVVLNILIAVPLGYLFYKSYLNVQAARMIVQNVQVNEKLYDVRRFLSLERAASMSILYTRPPSLQVLHRELTSNRARVDATLDNILQQSRMTSDPAVAKVMDDIMTRYAALKKLRQQLDASIEKPYMERDFSSSDAFFTSITAMVTSVGMLGDLYTRSITGYETAIAPQIRLARFVWGVGEHVGQEYALLGRIIAQNVPPGKEDLDNLLMLHHRIQYGLEIIHRTMNSDKQNVGFLPYLEEAETHYFITFEQIDRIFDGASPTQAIPLHPISVEIWIDMAAQAVDSLHALTDVIIKENRKDVLQAQTMAEHGIAVSFLLIFCALVVSYYTWWIITFRVVRPVNVMVDALYREMRRITGKGTDIPATGEDEIAKLSAVLNVFRGSSRQLQRERDRAQSASAAKSDFLANMSHEIRTPLNVVVGVADILERSSPMTAEQIRYVRTLKNSSHALLDLIKDLLDFSKIETHALELENITFNLADEIEDAASLFSTRAREKGIDMKVQIDALRHRTFRGDPMRIRQIITNLISNAVKFTNKGSILVKATCQDAKEPGRLSVTISVHDTGIGIAQDKLDLIFEKFTQADSSITRRYGGTGLGLSITKNLVNMMGGTISVNSTPGLGSVFTVSLSLHEENIAEPVLMNLPETWQKKPVSSDMSVLLVEDYAPNVIVTGTFLNDFGYTYDVAENGYQAILLYKKNNYRIVLMDLQMPEMDGYEVTRTIRRIEKKNRIAPAYIIGLTAHAMTETRQECLRAGMSDFISKPFTRQDLEEKLQKAMLRLQA